MRQKDGEMMAGSEWREASEGWLGNMGRLPRGGGPREYPKRARKCDSTVRGQREAF